MTNTTLPASLAPVAVPSMKREVLLWDAPASLGVASRNQSMSDGRLPIKVKRTPGGALLTLGTGQKIHIYGREPEVARTANTMTREEAEALAKDVARALSEAWEK